MKYETVDLGKGLTLPCIQLDLTGSTDTPARRELKAQIYHSWLPLRPMVGEAFQLKFFKFHKTLQGLPLWDRYRNN